MAIWRRLLTPIGLPPDEKLILRKRESLRSRGIGWLVGLIWMLSLIAIGITLLATKSEQRELITTLVNGVLILLAISLLPGALYVFVKWLAGTYYLTDSEIRSGEHRAARLLNVTPVILDLRQIDRVERTQPAWVGRMFNLGNIVLSTRTTPAALILRGIERPDYITEEIERRVALAHARARAGQEAAAQGSLAHMEIRRSGAWLGLQWLPLMLVTWGTVMAWIFLRLGETVPSSVSFTLFDIIVIGSLVVLVPWWSLSFLRWWLRVYVVTDRRVIQREGILNITRRVLSLDDVVTATAAKSGIGRFVDVGHVQVMTAGRSGDIHMRNISAPDYVRHRVLETQEQIRRQREQLDLADINRRLKPTFDP